MPAAARLGDTAQVQADAHGCPGCPHTAIGPIVTASTDVFVNDKGAARQDDLGIHAPCCGPNNFTITKGSATVYVNGKPFARMNDQTKHCGGTGPIKEGSPDVMVDDGAGGSSLSKSSIGSTQITTQQAAQPKQARLLLQPAFRPLVRKSAQQQLEFHRVWPDCPRQKILVRARWLPLQPH